MPHKKLINFFKTLYEKLVIINDSPQRVALGFGVGVFIGNLPGVGPVAALVTAAILRINKAAAVLGALLINTWFGIITMVVSMKLGCSILGIEWHEAYAQFKALIKDFHFSILFKDSARNVLLPFLLGQFIISLVLGIIGYLLVLWVIYKIKERKAHAIE